MQATKFLLVLNLKAAQVIGVKVSQSLLLGAEASSNSADLLSIHSAEHSGRGYDRRKAIRPAGKRSVQS